MNKKTLVLGASTNPARYAYLAAHRLKAHGHKMIPLGIKKGITADEPILNLKERPSIDNVDTLTLYLNPDNQAQWESYMLSLKPKRIIFNPGTENPSFAQKARSEGIETLNACTLVMLSTGQF